MNKYVKNEHKYITYVREREREKTITIKNNNKTLVIRYVSEI